MARYNSRSRRSNRRSYYRKKRPNTVARFLVIAVIIAVGVVLFFKRDKAEEQSIPGLDPDINDVVNDIMANGGGDSVRSVMSLPGTGGGDSGVVQEPNVSDIPPVIPVPARDLNAGENPEVVTLMAQAQAMYKNDSSKMVEVRTLLNNALKDMSMSASQRMLLKDELSKLAEVWLFGKTVYANDPLCDTYLVKSGDLLQRIGRNNDVPYQFLMAINNISRAENLRASQRIKIVSGPFHAVVKRSELTMDLYLKDTYVKTYIVGLGKPGHETPTGLWKVGPRHYKIQYTDPETKEVFMPDDPGYPIGPYYIELNGLSGEAVGRTGFAIHGTNKPMEIGMNTSSGCIRLRNEEVEEVYTLLAEGKSEVRVDP